MKKGTKVTYHCNGVTQLKSGNNQNDLTNKLLFDDNEVFEIVYWYRLNNYARIRPIKKGSKSKGVKTLKDYLTIKE